MDEIRPVSCRFRRDARLAMGFERGSPVAHFEGGRNYRDCDVARALVEGIAAKTVIDAQMRRSFIRSAV